MSNQLLQKILHMGLVMGKPAEQTRFKDLNSTVAKRGLVFIGLMTPDGAIWSRYQRAVLMR